MLQPHGDPRAGTIDWKPVIANEKKARECSEDENSRKLFLTAVEGCSFCILIFMLF
jgi:hypothetical protein